MKGSCLYCGGWYQIKKNGKLRNHNFYDNNKLYNPTTKCDGSDSLPVHFMDTKKEVTSEMLKEAAHAMDRIFGG